MTQFFGGVIVGAILVVLGGAAVITAVVFKHNGQIW